MVKQFETDPSRKKNLREIPETETSKPKKTFNIDEFAHTEYCEQIEPPVRMIEPASAINRATQCNRESH